MYRKPKIKKYEILCHQSCSETSNVAPLHTSHCFLPQGQWFTQFQSLAYLLSQTVNYYPSPFQCTQAPDIPTPETCQEFCHTTMLSSFLCVCVLSSDPISPTHQLFRGLLKYCLLNSVSMNTLLETEHQYITSQKPHT